MTVSLICLDVDGTLVGASGEPSDRLWQAADAATARGQHLAMCTARVALGPSWQWARRLDGDGWHAFHNGAALIHTSSAERRELAIDERDWAPLVADCTARGWVTEGYTATELAVDSDDGLARAHADLLGIEHRRRPIGSLEGAVVRLQVMCALADSALVSDLLPAELEASLATSPLMPGTGLVSITRAGVNKGKAVRDLAALAGVSLSETMMVGDGQNDLEALRAAGVSVAMGNADPLCVEIATHVVPSVEDHGAAIAIDNAARW